MEKRDLIKKFRSLVENGQPADRYTMLAYGYLRGLPYVALERVINEDKFEVPADARKYKLGVFGFLSFLARTVSVTIEQVENPENKLRGYPGPHFDAIYEWMMEKYGKEEAPAEPSAQESAA